MQHKESNMNIRRLQGLALIVSAVCFFLGLFGPQSFSLIGPQATSFYLITGILLFMLGIPAIHSLQPTGTIGLTGIFLLELAAFIPLLFLSNLMPSGLASSMSLTSALAGMVGAIIIGWLSTREHVFPAWLGWTYLAYGILNFVAGQINFGSLQGLIPFIISLLSIVVQFAYGYFIYQKPTKLTLAGEHKVPLA
jgi:hypothetical protein